MNDLILIALRDEAPVMQDWDNVFFTGVGKVNAAITASALIEELKPKRVWNFGTAGGIDPDITGLIEISNFVQRDMKCCELGFDEGITPFETEKIIGPGTGFTCSTGDNFVTDPNLTIPADVVDMEAYAIAKACQYHGVEFKCFKYISDNANEEANDDWAKSVDAGEQSYIDCFNIYKERELRQTNLTEFRHALDTSIMKDVRKALLTYFYTFDKSGNGFPPELVRPNVLNVPNMGYTEIRFNMNEEAHKFLTHEQIEYFSKYQVDGYTMILGINMVSPVSKVPLHSDTNTGYNVVNNRLHNILMPFFDQEYTMDFDGFSIKIPAGKSIILNTEDLHGLTNTSNDLLSFFNIHYLGMEWDMVNQVVSDKFSEK